MYRPLVSAPQAWSAVTAPMAPHTHAGRPMVLSPHSIQQRRQGARRLRGWQGRWPPREGPRFWGGYEACSLCSAPLLLCFYPHCALGTYL